MTDNDQRRIVSPIVLGCGWLSERYPSQEVAKAIDDAVDEVIKEAKLTDHEFFKAICAYSDSRSVTAY